MYDITKRATFEHVVDRWLVQLKTHTHQSIVLCLLGNKCDSKDLREVWVLARVTGIGSELMRCQCRTHAT